MRVALLFTACVAGLAAAAAVTGPVDYPRSNVGFIATLDGADFEGRFDKFRADVTFSEQDLAGSRFDVTIETASVNTQDEDRDEQLRAPQLFDAKKYPQARFLSTSFARKAPGSYEATGKLTIRDVTREIRVPFTYQSANEAGKPSAWIKGQTTIRRLDFGVGQDEWKETDFVANEVRIVFALHLAPAAAAPPK